MSKLRCRLLLSLIICFISLALFEKDAWAEGKMPVNITTQNGQSILIKEHETLYTREPIIFTPHKYEGKEGTYYYSVSVDYGATFGGYVPMEGANITLYQDTNQFPNDNFVLRFAFIENTDEKIENEADEGEDREDNNKDEAQIEEVIIEDLFLSSDKKNEEEIKNKNEVEIKNDNQGLEIYSRDYSVQFDNDAPVISALNEDVLSNWLTGEETLQISISDNFGKIKRVEAIEGENIKYEKSYEEDDEDFLFDIVLDKKSEGINGSNIVIRATDLAGNTSETKYTYYLDEDAPVLQITGISMGALITDKCSLHISASDDCMQESLIDYTLGRSIKDEMIIDEATGISCTKEGFDINICEEGRYELRTVAMDIAGNKSEEKILSFDVDLNAPEVTIEGVSENKDSSTKVDVHICVNEALYDNCNVSVTAIRRRDGISENLPISTFVMEASSQVCDITLKNEGDYTIIVTAVDGANHETSQVTSFRIDNKAPVISISGLEDGSVTNDKPVIDIKTSERFYESAIVDAVLSRKLSDDCYSVVDEKKYVMQDVMQIEQMTIGKEGEYRLACEAVDRTGNKTSKQIDFTVDYTPPVIADMDDIDEKYLKSYIVPGNITAFVSDLTSLRVDAFLNNDRIDEEKIVLEEGKYTLWIGATDAADNFSQKSATFIIDHTAPQIVLSGLKKDGNIKKGNHVKVSLADDKDELLKVTFNGENVELCDDGKSAEITIDEYGEYEFGIKAIDSAGNETDKIIHTSCIAAKPISDYMRQEKIIRSTSEQIVNYSKSDENYFEIIIGTFTALSGIAGLAIRELKRDR